MDMSDVVLVLEGGEPLFSRLLFEVPGLLHDQDPLAFSLGDRYSLALITTGLEEKLE